ncbi:hypothetical protein DSC45_34850 [Streptomyces sp. YIM 130001]|uniref:DUF6049 family protein n=1 Tax=Streptomyces sp. YIM 130001 TaxID=2259644 RepID=UPI000E649AAA|nr:DUF6049 family protein [Streptomyces sp. YIM 130001]RII06932.1 hypothetical protein DSC45_34850 [Streptomyces sp. YIM 130001]
MAEAADFQGMNPSPARRRLRRLGAALAAAPLLAGLLQVSAAPAAQAAPPAAAAAAATGSRTVDVALDSLTPSAPVDGDTLTVSGTVTNDSKQTVTDAEVDLRVGPAMNARSMIDNASGRSGYLPGSDGTAVEGDSYKETFKKLAPGVPQDFSLSIPVKELDLGADGVYQLGVALTGRTTAQPYDQVLGIQRTFLPWQTETASEPTRTTMLWPLISSTHLTAETGSDEQQTPVFSDDRLAEEITPGGRLEQMLSLGRDLPVTWVIDPDLLASVEAMTEPYSIRNPGGGDPIPGKNQAVAKKWLNDLQSAVKDKKVVALPFADPDLASLAHQGKSVSGSLSHLQDATEVATRTVQSILHVEPSTEFAWPAEGAIDPSIVDVATSAGADTVITRSDSLQERGGLPYTPTAARPIGGGNTAVVADANLSKLFQGDMTGAEPSTLAVQQFLAQSQMINLQDPEHARNIVVAPSRTPSASQAQAMAKAVQALDAGNWSQSVDLADAAKAKPDPEATKQVPGHGSYPGSLRKQELPKAAFESIRNTKATLDGFKVILSEPDRVVTPFGRAIDRAMSNSWRGRGAEGEQYRAGVQSYLDNLTKQVSLIPKTEAKLSGRSATIPVTVQNNLVQGVEHMKLRLTSTKPRRLTIGDGPFEEQQVKIAGGHSQSVKFDTTANANGKAAVWAQLYTEDGQRYGSPIRFEVNVTEVTPTVMLVLAGGFLLLVLAGFRMYTQRKRAAARRAAEDGDDGNGEGPEEPAPDAPDDSSDSSSGGSPDTAPDPSSDDSASDDSDDSTGSSGKSATDGSPSARGERGTAEDGADAPAAQDAESEAPQHLGDPAADTAAESTGPYGAGERVDR